MLLLEGQKVISSTWRDITELNRSKKEIESGTIDWEITFNSSTDLIVIMDKDLNIILRDVTKCKQIEKKDKAKIKNLEKN